MGKDSDSDIPITLLLIAFVCCVAILSFYIDENKLEDKVILVIGEDDVQSQPVVIQEYVPPQPTGYVVKPTTNYYACVDDYGNIYTSNKRCN